MLIAGGYIPWCSCDTAQIILRDRSIAANSKKRNAFPRKGDSLE